MVGLGGAGRVGEWRQGAEFCNLFRNRCNRCTQFAQTHSKRARLNPRPPRDAHLRPFGHRGVIRVAGLSAAGAVLAEDDVRERGRAEAAQDLRLRVAHVVGVERERLLARDEREDLTRWVVGGWWV